MLFDIDQIKKNKRRARKIGRKNFIQRAVFKNLEERVIELGLSLRNVLVLGAKEIDFTELGQDLTIEYSDHFNQEPVKETVDLILNVLNLHWSNNPKKDLSNQINLLKPGGIFMGCLFGADTLKELRDSFFKAEVQISGKARPRISPLPEIRDIGNLAQNVGMERVVADKESLTLEYKTVIELLKNLREMGETNSVLDRNKAFSRRDVFDLMEKYYNKNHPYEKIDKNNNGIRATFEIIYLYGEK